MKDLAPLFGYAVAAVFAVAALIFYNRLNRLQTLLTEAAKRFKTGQDIFADIEKKLRVTQERLDCSKENLFNMEKNLEEARVKYGNISKDFQDYRLKHEADMEHLVLQKEHLEEESAVLKTQLTEAESGRRASQNEAQMRRKDEGKKQEENQNKLQIEIRELRTQLNNLEKDKIRSASEAKKLREILTKVDPEAAKKAKQRATRMEQLYSTMKGLREMAEERNYNWEIALRKLATFILGKETNDAQVKAMPIGPLVGDALEIIGARLIDDELAQAELAEVKAKVIGNQEVKKSGSMSAKGTEALETVDSSLI